MEPLFLLALSCLFTHELDAMRRREWKLLPVFRSLDDASGEAAFLAAHVPLFAALIWIGWHADEPFRVTGRDAISAFCIVHVWLHGLFRNHPAYAFHGVLSVGLIWGAGLLGATYLIAAHVV